MKIHVGSKINEAALMIRGGKATKLFEIVNTIAELKNHARSSDLVSLFSQPLGFYTIAKSTPGIKRTVEGKRPFYSVTNELYQQYVDACKQLGIKPVPLYDSPSQPASQKASDAGSVIPFEQCFFAEMVLDAEDYSGPRECSWIDPKNLNHVLSVYEDYEGTPLSRRLGDLKQLYETLKESFLKDGQPRVARVGEDYDTIDAASVPGLKTYQEVWPKGGRGARVQKETSLCMCVAASRDKVAFDDNEWNSCPIKGGKNVKFA